MDANKTYPCEKCGRDMKVVDGGDFASENKVCVDCDSKQRDAESAAS